MELEHQIPLVFFKLDTGPEDDGSGLKPDRGGQGLGSWV